MRSFAFAASAAAAILAAAPSHAATLSATSNFPSTIDGFSITFDDTNGNGLFDLSELTSFSGLYAELYDITLEYLLVVPAIAGISVAGIVPGATYNTADWWNFSATDDLQWDVAGAPYAWTYEITGLAPSPVPLPASLPLLAGGVAALAAMRRRARRG